MEALALTAGVFSVVSLFLQVADKVQQLHDFWDSFQGAPVEIRNIALDLQTFSEILASGARSRVDDDSVLYKVLQRCDSKVESLKQMIERLEPGFASKFSIKRRWSSFKAVLRKDKLDEFQRSLAHTKIDLLLLSQSLVEKSFHQDIAALADSITSVSSQSSTILTKVASIESEAAEVNSHITRVHTELQRMVGRFEDQTKVEAGVFRDSDSQNRFLRTMCNTVPYKGMQGKYQWGNLKIRSDDTSSRSTKPPLDCFSKLKNTLEGEQQHPRNRIADRGKTTLPILQHSHKPFSRKRTVTSTHGEYRMIFGILSCRSRATQIYHEDVDVGSTDHHEFETTISIRPASWVSARWLDVHFSRGLRGWTWSGRQYRLISSDALIFKYCKNGSFAGAKDLFQHRLASPFDVDEDGRTPLHYAAMYGASSMCRLLIQAGADVDAVDDCLRSPLHLAEDWTREDKPDDAVIETFRALADFGRADTSLIDRHGSNFLDEVGFNQNRVKGVYWLLQQEWTDFDPNHLNSEETPIMTLAFDALGEADIPMLDLLIDKGVNINAQKSIRDKHSLNNDCGYTALHFSIRYICSTRCHCFNPTSPDFSHTKAAQLLHRGANPHITDGYGYTPTAMALAGGTIAFKFWQHIVRDFRNVQEFVKTELQYSSSLRNVGWDETSLSQMFSCDFEAFSSKVTSLSIDDIDYWNIAPVDHSIEPWWFDLLDLVKAKENPLPPLPRGWRKVVSDDGSVQYIETNTGMATSERPQETYFANLQTKKARRMYKRGLLRIQTEGCESELGDWCSDDDDDYSEDDDDLEDDEKDYSEVDECDDDAYSEIDDDCESRRTWKDLDDENIQENYSTSMTHNGSTVQDSEESDNEEEFYDAQHTPLAVPDP